MMCRRLIFELDFLFLIILDTTFIHRDKGVDVNSAALIMVTIMVQMIFLIP